METRSLNTSLEGLKNVNEELKVSFANCFRGL